MAGTKDAPKNDLSELELRLAEANSEITLLKKKIAEAKEAVQHGNLLTSLEILSL